MSDGKYFINVVVAGVQPDGVPGFLPVRILTTKDAYENGDHYDRAVEEALDRGWERPLLAYDENDGPSWLFDQFQWAAVVYVSATEPGE